METCDVCTIYSRDYSQDRDVDLVTVKVITVDGINLKVQALIDTGALRNDFISSRLVSRLKLPIRETNTKVCTGLNNQCSGAIGAVTVSLQYHNEVLRAQEIVELDLLVVNHDIDIIIGKVSTRRHELLKKLDSQIWSRVDALILEQTTSNATAELLESIPNPEDATGIPSPVHVTFSKDLYFDREDVQDQLDIEMILDDLDLNLPVEDDAAVAQEEDVMPTQIYGNDALQEKIRQLCRKYKRIFSRSIRKEPAKVDPMSIEIDLEKLRAANPPGEVGKCQSTNRRLSKSS
jgi:predicted aspartyl protease